MRTHFFSLLFLLFPVWVNAQLSREIKMSREDFEFIKEGDFDRIKFKNGFYITEVGKPELPVIAQSFVIPKDAKVSGLQVQIINTEKINGIYSIYPVQPPQIVGKQENRAAADVGGYRSLSVYPETAARIVEDRELQGYHIITVHIYPLSYFPDTKELYLRQISFTLSYARNNPVATSDYKISYSRASLAKGFIKSLVENPQDVDAYEEKEHVIPQTTCLSKEGDGMLRSHNVQQEIVPDYIIITSASLKSSFDMLAQWKIKKGVPTIIKTVQDIELDYQGFDLVDKIRNYILECKRKWGNNLFILLGGDISIVPSRTFKGNEGTEITDAYYSADESLSWDLQNPHWSNNNTISSYLGRIPIKNPFQIMVFISKILTYEKANQDIDYSYLKNSLIVNAYLGEKSGGYMGQLFGYCQNRPNNYWYLFDHFNCTKDDHQKQNYQTNNGEELNKDNFLYALQRGRRTDNGKFHFIYHSDHSLPTLIGASSIDKKQNITSDDVDGLSYSSHYYQVIMSTGCHPADFSKDCIAKHFLGKGTGGAVAFIGNTDVGFWPENRQLEPFLDGVFSDTAYNINQYSIGYLFLKAFNASSSPKCRLHLLGDPEMPVWTKAPLNLNVTITPDQITSGLNTIKIKINNLPVNQPARICLMKGEEVYTVLDVIGPKENFFTFTPRTSGNLDVTVTSHNFRPYETTIPVKTNTGSALTISNIEFDDKSRGNGDGQLDAGETIGITFTLKNGGATAAMNVTGRLSCPSGFEPVSLSPVNFGTIAAGAEVTCSTKIWFKIDKDAREILKDDLNANRFLLHMEDKEGVIYFDAFKVSVFDSRLRLGNKTITFTSNGDLIPQAGESVHFSLELQNEGKAVTQGLVAVLDSAGADIESYSSSPAAFPPIGKNQTARGNNIFSFRVKNTYVKGRPLVFRLKVTNAYAKEETFVFDLSERPARVGPTQIDFKPYDKSLDLYWLAYYSVSGSAYNIYRSQEGIYGNYVKLNALPLSYKFFKDEKLNPSAVYYYKISCVSASGNEGPLSAPFKAWTTPASTGSFPRVMAMSNGIIGSVNVGDVNNDGKKEIFATTKWYDETADGYLIGLRPDGNELFDIDGRPGTFSGFARLQSMTEATPAIGDLYGKGEENIVTLTRNADASRNYLSCFAARDEDGDGKPDLLWQTLIGNAFCRGAVLANVDNSSDGTLEIIVGGCDSTNPIRIYGCDGKLRYSFDTYGNYACLAVADLDGDGDKEIIASHEHDLYIWHHDGKAFKGNPFFTVSGKVTISSSPIVCDLNGDGRKEILIATNRADTSYIYAIGTGSNQTVTGWNGTQCIPYDMKGLDHGLSVGDINGDGKLEVAALGTDKVRVWSHIGEVLLDKKVPGVFREGTGTKSAVPILADVDGDNMPEILFGANKSIHALHLDGSEAVGFPIETNNFFLGSLCVSDVDNDGKNELLAGDFGGYLYNWETNGKPSGIQWGSERHDNRNTGEYGSICSPLLVTANTVWSGTQYPCGDIIVESGKLTVPSGKSITLGAISKIIVRKGATLEIDGGTLRNAYVRALDGSNVILKNGGQVILRNPSCLEIELGAQLDDEYGNIE